MRNKEKIFSIALVLVIAVVLIFSFIASLRRPKPQIIFTMTTSRFL